MHEHQFSDSRTFEKKEVNKERLANLDLSGSSSTEVCDELMQVSISVI
jgi:hypothetical protein